MNRSKALPLLSLSRLLPEGAPLILILGILLLAASAFAGEAAGEVFEAPTTPSPATAATPTWSGEAEAGLVMTGGNTKTQSADTKLRINYRRTRWDHRLSLEYLNAADDNATTAERASASLGTRYLLSVRDYLFGILRGDSDRFSGYAQQLTESAGYGRRFLFSPDTTLETEAGAGGRQVRQTGGTNTADAILRLAMKFRHKFGQASEFKEEAFSEIGSDNVHTESVTSLGSRIDGNLSMKASFTTTHNSRAPENVQQTDTITSLTLVFAFGE